MFRRSSRSNPGHRDGPRLRLIPHSAWVIKLLEAPCHVCPLININYRGSCSLAHCSPLLFSSLPPPPLHPPDWTNHWAIRRWRILNENRSLCLVPVPMTTPLVSILAIIRTHSSTVCLHAPMPPSPSFFLLRGCPTPTRSAKAVFLGKNSAVVFLYISPTVSCMLCYLDFE